MEDALVYLRAVTNHNTRDAKGEIVYAIGYSGVSILRVKYETTRGLKHQSLIMSIVKYEPKDIY